MSSTPQLQVSLPQSLVSNDVDSIISGSWDKTFRIHSPQSGTSPTIIPVPEKIFTMDVHENTLVIGMSNRLNYIYDLRKLDEPLQRRDSSLKFMTRAIKLTPTGDGTHLPDYAPARQLISSIRVVIDRRKNSIRLDKPRSTITELRVPSASNRKSNDKSQYCIPRQHTGIPSYPRDICEWRRRRVDCDMGSHGTKTSEILRPRIRWEYREYWIQWRWTLDGPRSVYGR